MEQTYSGQQDSLKMEGSSLDPEAGYFQVWFSFSILFCWPKDRNYYISYVFLQFKSCYIRNLSNIVPCIFKELHPWTGHFPIILTYSKGFRWHFLKRKHNSNLFYRRGILSRQSYYRQFCAWRLICQCPFMLFPTNEYQCIYLIYPNTFGYLNFSSLKPKHRLTYREYH